MRRKKPKDLPEPVVPFKYSPKITLQPGDVFRCTGGPYYITSDGIKINMGERGLFRFVDSAKDGIIAIPNKRGETRRVFIYMGEEKISATTGTYLRPHKIRKLRKKNN